MSAGHRHGPAEVAIDMVLGAMERERRIVERDALRARLAEIEAEMGEPDAASDLSRRESEERSRSLLDEVEVGLWSLSPEAQRTVYVNPALTRITGRPREAFFTEGFSMIPWLHPDDREVAGAVRAARLRGEAGEFEARVLRPDGEVRWCRFRAHAVRDHAGHIDRVDLVVFDVTEQRLLEEALRSGERRFRRIAELGWNVILLLDRSREVLRTFGSQEALTGYTPEEYAALPAEARFHPDDWPLVEATFRAAMASPAVAVPLEARRPKKGGGWVWTESLVVNLLDDPDVGAVVSTTRDITARKQAEQALADANKELSRRVAEATASLTQANTELTHAARAKDDFLANMSHELRTPLNAVLGLTEALDEGIYGPVADKQRQALERISTSASHLLSLINDILDLSKVEAGRIALEISTTSLAEVCRGSLALVEGAARQKRINVSLQLSDGFGVIEADPRRLKQILVNLLSNAVKFTPDGGSAGVEVHADEHEGLVRFVVWDTGIGIEPGDLPRLFNPFVQIDSSLSRAHAGTGLGLALVRRLVDLHGGSVEVESAPGKGCRFTVRLPQRRRAAPQPDPSPGAAHAPLALIVEDSAPAAEQLSRYLGELGIASIVHREPRGVVDRAAAEQPALILLDILLPAAVGLTILRELKANPRTAHIPVIVVSVLDRREESLALGAVEHLVKPFTREMLHAAITRITGGKQVERPVLIVGAVAPTPAPAVAGRRVLVAEDDETNVDTILEFLRAQGYEVYVARNGREAVELAAELLPEAVLMDIQMPIMDGLTAIRALRAHARPELRAMPVIALTALAMVGDRERCLEAGADEYLPKPVGLRKLASALEAILSRRAAVARG